jgi:hypothetical protein
MGRCACGPRGLALPLLLLLHAIPGLAQLTITSGPAELVERAFDVAPYRFSGPAFAPVVGALVLSERSDWVVVLAAPCAPRYVGAIALEGAIVLHANAMPDLVCSAEAYARAAGDAGAVGWLLWDDARTGKMAVPGAEARAFADADSRALASPPAADACHHAFAPIVDALREGEALRATLAPQRSEYDALFDGSGWAAWRALLILQALAALELAACRLYAFMRWQGAGAEQCGLPCCRCARRARNVAWPAAAQPLCLLYVILNSYRLAYFLVDPWHSRGIFSLALNCLLSSCDNSMAASGSSLFLICFAAVARANALAVAEEAGTDAAEATASFCARVPLARAALFAPVAALAFINLLFDFCASLTFFWLVDRKWLAARVITLVPPIL